MSHGDVSRYGVPPHSNPTVLLIVVTAIAGSVVGMLFGVWRVLILAAVIAVLGVVVFSLVGSIRIGPSGIRSGGVSFRWDDPVKCEIAEGGLARGTAVVFPASHTIRSPRRIVIPPVVLDNPDFRNDVRACAPSDHPLARKLETIEAS